MKSLQALIEVLEAAKNYQKESGSILAKTKVLKDAIKKADRELETVSIIECPFCHSDNLKIYSHDRGPNEGNDEYECVIQCEHCYCSGPFSLHTNEEISKKIAINLWNTRAKPTE